MSSNGFQALFGNMCRAKLSAENHVGPVGLNEDWCAERNEACQSCRSTTKRRIHRSRALPFHICWSKISGPIVLLASDFIPLLYTHAFFQLTMPRKANPGEAKPKAKPKAKNPLYIDWKNSEAKKIIMNDLMSMVLPCDEKLVSTQAAFEHYKQMPEFQYVVYSQFEARLKDHRKAVGKKIMHHKSQMEALAHDQALYPRKQYDRKGRKMFHGSEAHNLLKQDVEAERHLTLGYELLYYSRIEYWGEDSWDYDFFRRRVRQEFSTQKFHHHMEVKRAAKELKKKKASEKKKAEQDAMKKAGFDAAAAFYAKQNNQGDTDEDEDEEFDDFYADSDDDPMDPKVYVSDNDDDDDDDDDIEQVGDDNVGPRKRGRDE